MRNGDLRQEAIERLKAAQIRYREEIDTLEKSAAELLSLRYQTAHVLIDQLGLYLGSLTDRPPVLERAFNTFNTRFAAFATVAGQCEPAGPGSSRAHVESSIAVAFAGVFTASAIEALAGQDPAAPPGVEEIPGSAIRLGLVRLDGATESAGTGGPDTASVSRLLSGPAEWSIASAAHEGCSLFVRSRNRILAEEANVRRKAIETRNARIGTAIQEIDRLLESTARHHAGVTTRVDDLRASTQGRPPTDESDTLACTSALAYHLHALSKLLDTRIGVLPRRAARPDHPLSAAIETLGALPNLQAAPGACEGALLPGLPNVRVRA